MDKKQTRLLKVKNGLKIALLSAIIFSVFILTLEVVLRTTHLFDARISNAEPDSLLGWRYVPNSSYWYNKENDHPIWGKINSFGWRDKERSIEKPDDTYRIAVIGDSYVEALQVELDSTFLVIAENQLNKDSDIQIELMNFGRSGMTQTEEMLVLKNDVSPFSPDFVIVFFLPSNDIKDINRKTSHNKLRPYYEISKNGELLLDTSFNKTSAYKFRTITSSIKQRSALASLCTERYNWFRQTINSRNIADPKELKNRINGFLSLCTATPDPIYQKNYRLNKKLINEMANHCKKNKIKFMLVNINSWFYKPKDIEKYKLKDLTFNEKFFHDDLNDFCNAIGVEYLGLQKPFREYYEKEKKTLNWSHWNYLGHRLVADILSQKIKTIMLAKE